MNLETLKMSLIGLNQKPIAYYPIYADICNDVLSGILLSQIMFYWASFGGEKFTKTDADLRRDTRMTIRTLKSAKNKLKKLDFLKITKEGVPGRTFYDIDIELFSTKLSETVPTSLHESYQLDGTNRPNSYKRIKKDSLFLKEKENVPTEKEGNQQLTAEEKEVKKMIGRKHFDIISGVKGFPITELDKLQAFYEWLEHKKLIRDNYAYWKNGLELIAKEFEQYPIEAIRKALEQSRKMKWKGIFIEKQFKALQNGKSINETNKAGNAQQRGSNRRGSGQITTAERQIGIVDDLLREGL